MRIIYPHVHVWTVNPEFLWPAETTDPPVIQHLLKICQTFGADRIMWDTDRPVFLHGATYAQTVKVSTRWKYRRPAGRRALQRRIKYFRGGTALSVPRIASFARLRRQTHRPPNQSTLSRSTRLTAGSCRKACTLNLQVIRNAHAFLYRKCMPPGYLNTLL